MILNIEKYCKYNNIIGRMFILVKKRDAFFAN